MAARHWDRKWAILERRATRQSFEGCLYPLSDWFEVSVGLGEQEQGAGASGCYLMPRAASALLDASSKATATKM